MDSQMLQMGGAESIFALDLLESIAFESAKL